MLNKVSQRVLDAVFARLSSSTDGFNIGISTQAVNYGIPTNFIQIDFSPQSQNFMLAQINPELIEKSGIMKYPFACLYILETGQTGEQRFNQFSGAITCIFDVWVSWKQIKGLYNFEAYLGCVEDVVIDVINRTPNQNWGKPLVYNGMIRCSRGPLTYGGNNFLQMVRSTMVFGLHQ